MKNKMRELTDDEKGFAQKVIDGRISEKKHVELMIKYNDFMIDEMLESNYLEKKREFKRQTDALKNESKEIQLNIDRSIDQIKNGVEVKEEVGNDNVPTMVE